VAALADLRRDVVLTTTRGRVTKLPVKSINSMGRAAAGNRSRTDTKDIFVDPAKQGIPALLTVLAGTKAAAKRARSKGATDSSKESKSPRATEARKTASKRATKKASSSRERSATSKAASGQAKKEAPAQLPLPMQSAPAKRGRKTTPTKGKSVRSVPES
jgi:DNA gyrase/topoisomerase IV subunit A